MSIVPVTGVTLAPKTSSVVAGATRNLAATVAPATATNKTVTYSSSAPLIAKVTNSGVVTGVAEGSAVITVATQDGSKTDTCNLTVTAAL